MSTVSIHNITTGTNVRTKVGDIRELAKSIEAVGLLNPLTVRKVSPGGNGLVELVAGHRRLEALRRLEWADIPVTYIDTDDDHRLATQLIENLHREDLTALEEAAGLSELTELLGSASKAAAAVGRSKAHVSKRLALLKLPTEVTELVTEGIINLEQAATFAKLDEGPALEVAAKFSNGVHPQTAQAHLDGAIADQERAKARARFIDELNATNPIPASSTMPAGGRSLEGWDGLTVDYDEHLAEPCARWRVRFERWESEPRKEQVCADPDRHTIAGDSDLIVPPGLEEERKAQAEADRQREAAERAEATARRVGEAKRVALALTDRNAALRGLAIAVLTMADPHRLIEALELVGVDLPEEPPIGRGFGSEEHRQWWDSIERLPTGDTMSAAETYRAAAYVALRELGPCGDHAYQLDRPAEAALAELFGVDLNTITGRTRGTTTTDPEEVTE